MTGLGNFWPSRRASCRVGSFTTVCETVRHGLLGQSHLDLPRLQTGEPKLGCQVIFAQGGQELPVHAVAAKCVLWVAELHHLRAIARTQQGVKGLPKPNGFAQLDLNKNDVNHSRWRARAFKIIANRNRLCT